MKQYPFLASRIFGTPLLIEPRKLEVILHALGPSLGFEHTPTPEAATFDDDERRRAGYRVERGVAIIPVYGTLINRGGWLSAMSGVASYTRLNNALSMAVEDDDVHDILFDYDTPGGEAAGVYALGERIYQLRGQKRMTAIVNELTASAGVWLASAADEIVITRTGEAGSIGVVMTHYSQQNFNEKLGVKVTHIHAGARKVDFSPHYDLTPEALEAAQTRIDELYELFTGTVARNLNISQNAIKATEAGMFSAQAAVDNGLAHRIDSFDNVLANLQTAARPLISSITTVNRGNAMSTENPTGHTAEQQQLIADAEASARQSERTRIQAILDHPEAQGREALARTLAFTTDMTPEAAAPILKAAPAVAMPEETSETSATQITPFEQAMGQHSNASIAPDNGDDPTAVQPNHSKTLGQAISRHSRAH